MDRIVDAWPVEGRRVLEIGPGQGVLTFALLEAGALVDAIEYDPRLVQVLSTRFSREISEERLTLHLGDAAREPWPPFQVMVSNLPYSISSPVVFRLLETRYEAAVLMFQREFAERMRAFIGTPDCGRLSVMVQTFARVEACFVLSPSSFSPHRRWNRQGPDHPRDPLFPVEDRGIWSWSARSFCSGERPSATV